MYVNVGKTGGLFHVEAINCKFNQNTRNGEEKKGVFFRNDVAMISQKGKAMSAVERLMKQKDFIREYKDSLLAQMADKESGYCSADIAKKIEEYEKQLDSIDEEIAKELAKSTDESDELRENNMYKGKQPLTKQELYNKRLAELTEMSAKLDQSEVMDSVKDRLEGEKNVLEAELKSGDSERKRQRIAEIDERAAELTKETFAGVGEIVSKPENKEILVEYQVSKEGRDNFQYQVEHGTRGTFSDKNLDVKKAQQDSIYYEMIENSDNGFARPTIQSQLNGAYSNYLEQAIEKGKDPEENIYGYIVDIHRDSLMKAYQDVYQDIVTGYENGTREVWTQNFEEGADYIEFELEGKNYRFHKLTMEEELAQLDKAYKKEARNVADAANLMIDTQKRIEKVMPEYQEKMREIEARRAGRRISEVGEVAERIKNKISMSEENTERINLFEMLMEARKNWLNLGKEV